MDPTNLSILEHKFPTIIHVKGKAPLSVANTLRHYHLGHPAFPNLKFILPFLKTSTVVNVVKLPNIK